MRRVRKIKVDKTGKKITIDWEVQVGNTVNYDEYHMKCSDRARPEFYEALKDLAQDVIKLLEYPVTWINDITVRGVSFSYSDDGVKGAVITASRELHYSVTPENCNTPHKPYEMYSADAEDTDGTIVMPEDTQKRLDWLDDEANRYIDGDKAQQRLDFEEESKPA